MTAAIDTAVVLAAGEGTRLQELAPHKPLCRVRGKALIAHAIERLHVAGIVRVVVVTGFGSDAVEAFLEATHWPIAVETIRNERWELPNGVSALAARPLLDEQPCLLTMADHLIDPRLYRRVNSAGAGAGLRLGIDRQLDSPLVDPSDVTRVKTEGERIVAIGKGLADHDSYDTGVFAVAPRFFDALADLERPSITDAVRALAKDGDAEVVDCTGLAWIDVDDLPAQRLAEALLRTRTGSDEHSEDGIARVASR